LRILQKWCEQNFFLVNLDKTGILRVGQVDSTAEENFKIHGKILKDLKEKKKKG